tara:strand:- start:49426 stop:49887 length:462 start_codon:yes stop_codon:yes gene_type:complete
MPSNSIPIKDIHVPPPIAMWPTSPGWYILLALVIIAVAVGGYFLLRYLRKKRFRKLVLRRFDQLRQQADLIELSVLLKRIAIHRFSRAEVAGLQNQSWIDFLQNSLPKKSPVLFKGDIAELLITAPYQRKESIDKAATAKVFIAAKIWVENNL